MSVQAQCNVCGESFPSRTKLFTHISKLHSVHQVSGSASNKKQCFESSLDRSSEDEKALEGQIKTIEEDEHYRVILKPQGIATMGGKGITLNNSDVMLLPNALKLNLPFKKATPCHRLDKETGGLVVCGKTKVAHSNMCQSFRNKWVYKKYLAIVVGKLEPLESYITIPIYGKETITRYKVLKHTNSKRYGTITTVALFPITGRKHQLRRHLQFIGHSILGDKRYSHAKHWPENTERMFLFSVGIELPHPSDTDKVAELCGDMPGGNDDDDNDDDDKQDFTAAAVAIEETSFSLPMITSGMRGNVPVGTPSSSSDQTGTAAVSVNMSVSGTTVESGPATQDEEAQDSDIPAERNTTFCTTDCQKYDSIGYGCVRADFVANDIRMIRVEIPEPLFYEEFRVYHERLYAEAESQAKAASERSVAVAVPAVTAATATDVVGAV